MSDTPREAAKALLTLHHYHQVSTRYSSNNGTILLVWAGIFFLDMLLFELSYGLHFVLLGIVSVTVVNVLVLVWRFRYARSLPVRPLRPLTNRVIFWWSWFYIGLLGGGLAGWAFIIGPFPVGWLSFLGFVGAIPLAAAGLRLRHNAYQ